MEEKVLIRSRKYNVLLFSLMIVIIGLVIYGVFYAAYGRGDKDIAGIVFWALLLISLVVAALVFLGYNKVELTVTDKRVYGRAQFGKRVDLPFDSISAIGTSMMNGIAVTSASGAIKFKFIKNRDEIHEIISKQLVERQGKEKPVSTTTIKQEIPRSNADELQKYKNLLDNGTITQEEFDAKKKQLLRL